QYLLLYGTPAEIPWDLQYNLSAAEFRVGRLDLTGESLDNYVRELLSGWATSQARIERPVVWASDQGDRMTALMRDAIAQPVYDRLCGDPDIREKATFL